MLSVPIASRTPPPKQFSPSPAKLALTNLVAGRSWPRGIAFGVIGLAVLAVIGWEATRHRGHFSPNTSLPVTSSTPEPLSKPPEAVPAEASAIKERPASDNKPTSDVQFNTALAHFNQAVEAKDAASLKLRVLPEFQQIAEEKGPRASDAEGYVSSAIPKALRSMTPRPPIGCGPDLPDPETDVRSSAFAACWALDPPKLQWVQFSWPDFPARARQVGLGTGLAMLSLTVDQRGAVIGAWSRVKPDPYGFASSALQAALKWRTTVPRAYGKAVGTQLSVDVPFSQ
jgi:hypothetical protein